MNDFGDMPRVISGGKRAPRKFLWIFGSLLALFVVIFAGLEPYADYLWFAQDVRYPKVFSLMYETKGLLFIPAFVLVVGLFYWTLARALKVSTVYDKRPETPGELIVSRVMSAIQSQGPLLTKIASMAVGLLMAIGFSDEWNTYLLWSHSHSFGRTDPTFNRDLGFFVFQLPWFQAVANFLFGLFLTLTIVAAAIYIGLGMLAALAKAELSRPAVRVHLSVLLGLTVLFLGVDMYLKRFEFGLIENSQFTGGGYSAAVGLAVKSVLCFFVMALGIAIIVNGWLGKPYKVAIYGGGSYVAAHIIGVLIVPALTQAFVVDPDKIGKESPFAKNAMQMTRYAYGLDSIETKETTVRDQPTPAELAAAQPTLDNMRLWDPTVLKQTLVGLQGLKPYYQFNDVDLDRYTIGGKQQMVMLSPRDINVAGLGQAYQTWINTRLVYTHGYGIAMCPVNAANASGQPEFLVKDLPPTSIPEIPIDQPRVYFSDYRDSASDYMLVDTKYDEFDYPGEKDDVHYRWTADHGITIGNFFKRLMFTLVLGDFNLLVSGNVTDKTRVLLHRGILERASKVYPFLSFDGDPYLVVLSGQLIWVLDTYITTDRIPYSARYGSGEGQFNYIRNAVKVTVDAYTGETRAYEIQQDPILDTYKSIYPGLIHPVNEMPKGLEAHFRYPEDMFKAQSVELTQYHVEDPTVFLNNSDAWDMPTERGLDGAEEQMRPYYVEMRLPDQPNSAFLLILPFTPLSKGNMSGWLAANCDPGSYGKMVLYKYPKGSTLSGPKQEEAYFTQNDAIANLNKLLNSEQSKLVVGNLLVIPIGQSVMYVEPMFLQSQSIQPIPELKKVILALNKTIVVGDSYKEALTKLFGAQENTPQASPPENPPVNSNLPTTSASPPSAGPVPRKGVQEALDLADQADKALRGGDFAKYGDLQKQLKAKLQTLLGK